MAVHGVNSTAKGKTAEAGDWTVKLNTGKPALDEKGKPLSGLSFQAANVAARAYLNRTGVYVVPIRG